MRLILSITLCILLISCEASNSVNNESNTELVGANKKWKSLNSQNYTFENNRACECSAPYTYTVEVVNGKIKDVHFEKLDQFHYESKDGIISSTRTIDELFDLLEHYKEIAASFEVEYHKELGYPTKINIDPFIEMADEEIILKISDLVIIDD